MFVHHCTACSLRQLIFPSQITGLADSADGVQLAFTCWCGETQTHPLGRADVDVAAT